MTAAPAASTVPSVSISRRAGIDIVSPSGVDTCCGCSGRVRAAILTCATSQASASTQRDAAEHRAQRQHGAEDLLVADLAEPPPVGGEFDGIGQHERQQHRDDQDEGAKGQPHDDPPV